MKQTQMCESHVHLKTTDELKLFLGHVHTSRRRERGEQITTTDIPAPAIAKNLRVELSRGRMSRPFWACNVAPQPCSHSACGLEKLLPGLHFQSLKICKWSQNT